MTQDILKNYRGKALAVHKHATLTLSFRSISKIIKSRRPSSAKGDFRAPQDGASPKGLSGRHGGRVSLCGGGPSALDYF